MEASCRRDHPASGCVRSLPDVRGGRDPRHDPRGLGGLADRRRRARLWPDLRHLAELIGFLAAAIGPFAHAFLGRDGLFGLLSLAGCVLAIVFLTGA